MTIFGKPFSAYVAFSKWLALLILAVGLTRLALSLSGMANSETQWFSMTAVAWLSAIILAIRVPRSGFGTYRHLLMAIFVVSVAFQAVSVTGIVIGIITGHDNVFTAPEFFFGEDGKNWLHVGAHLVLGTTAGSIVPWIPACLVMFVTQKIAGKTA